MTDRSSRSDTSDFLALVERLPFVGTVTKEIAQLRALLLDRRAPRLLALGVSGAGKTTLVNALLGSDVLPALPASAEEGSPAGATPDGETSATLPTAHGSWMHMRAQSRQLAWLELESREEPWGGEAKRLLDNALDERRARRGRARARDARSRASLPALRDADARQAPP
jgi:hypothetical protein